MSKSPSKRPTTSPSKNSSVVQSVTLTEKEVEVDHLQTVILALNQKVQITNDIQKDLGTKQTRFAESETSRTNLQNEIRSLVDKAEQDQRRNKAF